ncbi:MAG TPA: NAD(P)/FAD-dependent oxidoreductase [Methanosarcinales archaeon]|nr:NAD(P)/FAD-dependent oxidoreductase [Methanosarcinales archaeon]
MKTIIIGGGLAGLASAYKLVNSSDNNEVLILEKNSELGGMAASYSINGYYIEKYYHHIFKGDSEIIALLKELSLINKLEWRIGRTGYYINNKVYPLNTPLEILKYPALSFLDKVQLALLVLKAKKTTDYDYLDNITAKKWILDNARESLYLNFFEPLLQGKFGNHKDIVSAAWLLSRMKIRSNRSTSGETLGYLRGGFQLLIDALSKNINKSGNGEIRTNCEVNKIITENGKVKGVSDASGKFSDALLCDNIISTVSPATLNKLLIPYSQVSTSNFFSQTRRYQGTACALFGLNHRLMDDIYWLNIKASDFRISDISWSLPFGAIIEHTNFIPIDDYNEHLVYVTSYFQNPRDPLWSSSEKKVINWYLRGLKKLFPNFKENMVNWWRLTRNIDTAPVYETGYKNKILPYLTNIKGLYLAGMFSKTNYPERSMNGSILAGFKCAEIVNRT